MGTMKSKRAQRREARFARWILNQLEHDPEGLKVVRDLIRLLGKRKKRPAKN